MTIIPEGREAAPSAAPWRWLLSARNRVIAVADNAYAVVDIDSGQTVFSGGSTGSWAMLNADASAYSLRLGASLVERSIDWSGDRKAQRAARAQPLDEACTLCAVARDGDEMLMAVSPPSPEGADRGTTFVLRKRFDGETGAVWQKKLGGSCGRVPMLDDGTILLPLQDGLARVRGNGQDLPRIDVRLLPDLVSVDARGVVCGFVRSESQTDLVLLTPETKISMALPIADPVQPPVLLPDGRIILVAAKRIACVASLSVAWTQDVPEGNAFVTGTLDNRILLRAGSQCRILSNDGREMGILVAPRREPIRSNPLVMMDGRICLATTNAIYCYSAQ